MSDEAAKEVYARAGLGASVTLGSRPCVLVIDFSCGFTDPDCALGSNLTPQVEATRRLLDAARARGLPAVFRVSPRANTDFAWAWATRFLVQLGNATGAQFDQMFLTMMIEHHRSAISAAQEEIEQGSNPEAKELAEKIVADQTAEIDRMQQMQAG